MAEIEIQVIRGESKGLVHRLKGNTPYHVGRDTVNDLVLTDRGVSRRHCTIFAENNQWQLQDLGSTNGVVLNRLGMNGAQMLSSTAVPLMHADELEIGDACIRLRMGSIEERTLVLNPSDFQKTELREPNSFNSVVAAQRSLVAGPANAEQHSEFSIRASSDAIANLAEHLPYEFRNFRLHRKIGEGGMGEVFLATRINEGKAETVAIKFLRSNASASLKDYQRFMREIEICTTLNHSSIIPCLDCGEEQGRPYIVMPYCSAGNLANILERIGPLSLRRALRLIDRLLAGVEHAHGMGIVHRDLKPFNILLHQNEMGKYLPRVSDFGLAKSYLLAGDSGLTVNGSVGGSWAYMPKEQLTNFRFVSPQSDVWSLGAILFECLTRQLPREHDPASDPIRTILESKLIPLERLLPDVPRVIAVFVSQSLSNDLNQRYIDAQQMRHALRISATACKIDLN